MSKYLEQLFEKAFEHYVKNREEELGRPLTDEEIDAITEEDVMGEDSYPDYDSEWKDDKFDFPWRNDNGN